MVLHIFFKGMEVMSKKVIGIDIGGTNVKIGVLNMMGDILTKWEIKTNKKDQGNHIVNDIWSSVQKHLTPFELEHDILGVGIGVPGFIDQNQGKILAAVNIGWKEYELKKVFEAKTPLPVVVENDANTAALGEYWRDKTNKEDLIMITLGTGVGSGIITNGKVLHGSRGLAGEIGHFVVNPNGYLCNCGRRGCLDTIASATGVVREAMQIVHEVPASNLAKFYLEHGKLTAKDVFDLAKIGDEHCQKIIEQLNEYLGFALANLATIINPGKILIGGGLSKAGHTFLQQIEAAFYQHAHPWVSDKTELGLAQLGNDAGIIGAAYLIKKTLKNDYSHSF